jgi:hypothetical protein
MRLQFQAFVVCPQSLSLHGIHFRPAAPTRGRLLGFYPALFFLLRMPAQN